MHWKKLETSPFRFLADTQGKTYPLDIWYILSAYIRPEDIGRFAQLCKSAYEVTQSSNFWRRLYKRYYSQLKVLPARLQPDSMERLYELKTCTIRSLFHLYPGFIERLRNNQIHEPSSLLKRICVSFWHQKCHGMFHYFFKMQERSDPNMYGHVPLKQLTEEELIEELGNINANPQYGCKVLQVSCSTFTAIPSTIFGETLVFVSAVLSRDLRTHTLRLGFGPGHALNHTKKGILFSQLPEGSVGVLLNSVMLVKVLDWWHPSYPNSTTTSQCASESTAIDTFF